MRLKQLLSSVGMLLILSTVAFAANTQSTAAPAIAASQSVAANKSAAPAPTSAKAAATPTSSSVATPAPVVVRNVSVVQGEGTINVEIATNGPITPKATRLSAPARIVLDFPNSIPAGRNQVVPVESGRRERSSSGAVPGGSAGGSRRHRHGLCSSLRLELVG